MAGVRFDHQPHLLAWGELQGIAGGQSEVDFQFDSALHPGHDDYIAGAESDRRGCGQKDVSGANSDAKLRAHAAAYERGFEQQGATVAWNETGHGAAGRMYRFDHGVEYIFEAHELRDGFLHRRSHDFVGSALRDDASRFEDDHALAQGEDFFPAVSYIKNRNAVCMIPLTKVVDDF